MVTSRSAVPETARERLAPPSLVVGLALGIVLTLVLLFNPASILRRIARSHAPAVDLYFAKAAAHHTHSDAMMLLLAREEVATGHDFAALRALAPLMKRNVSPAYRKHLLWLYYRDLLAMNARYPRGSAERERNEAALRRLIAKLRRKAGEQTLFALAREAIAIHDTRAAIAIYLGLARHDRTHRAPFYALAASATSGLHRPREAARFEFMAQRYAPTRAAEARYFLAALRILQSHDLVAAAVAEGGRHLGDLAKDRAILRRMIVLARAANEPRVAARYARRLLGMT
ncbi:hypothetical protein [Acidiferrobacter sp.]|uniref:hypothetical protein n=1 Tax=Acidiferrobacter sp. TaxID=1872107 RepID=UPI00261B5EEB|nr:hypothetical protein [Acidiferrobacter sp.]